MDGSDHIPWNIHQKSLNQRIHICGRSQSEQGKSLFFCNASGISASGTEEGNHLIQQRLRITHSSIGGAGDHINCGAGNCHIFSFCDQFQTIRDQIGGNSSQIESLTPGDNCRQNFIDFCCCKNKFCMSGRFFNGFQQSIPRTLGKHVDFVDDVNFIFRTDRQMDDFFTDFAGFIHLRVGRRVDFNHVHTAFFCNCKTRTAFAAGFSIFRMFTVECFCKNSSGSCFSDPARSHKKICLSDSVTDDRIFQRAGNMFLSDHIGKLLRTPFSCYNLICHKITSVNVPC